MTFREYIDYQWQDLLLYTFQHIQVVLIAVGLGALIAIVVGTLVYDRPVARQVILTVTATMLTIPSFAMFGLLIPWLGLGAAPTIFALTFYAIFPILRNVITGLQSVPAEVEEAARGMGLSARRRLILVRVPLAWPVLLNGVRVATILCVAIAAIAAAVNGPGLGKPIFEGLARVGGANALNATLSGVIGVMAVALILDLLFILIARLTTSRGIRD
ncbi:ABC transporter permease [Solicola gregarius]|uniref:ABC transporter permease n=1 Tax=Solicola gregarius TaxID=2908642 RepID=A0AA46TNF5_9ACTN|nr:ABC transporter permease [Solicola gregarius]UYM07583.1 ABC transporter permease [Solicola gregarius]